MADSTPLLQVKDLYKWFPVLKGWLRREVARVHALSGVSFQLDAQETLGIVGESGCGKSTLAKTLVRLYNPDKGQIIFDGKDLTPLRGKKLRAMRRSIQMVFQDPLNSLNSRMTIADIIQEPFTIHGMRLPAAQEKERVAALLDKVGLSVAAAHRYPHEFSGGQCQRIGIARALALKPRLLICDEPVSALDVSIQSQVMNLLLELQREFKLAYIFIAHDLTVVRHVSDQILVMYLGEGVEYGPAESLYNTPLHPYSKALISAVPNISFEKKKKQPLKGEVASPINPPSGCRFHTRCSFAEKRCLQEKPQLRDLSALSSASSPHMVACHYAEKLL